MFYLIVLISFLKIKELGNFIVNNAISLLPLCSFVDILSSQMGDLEASAQV